MISLTGVLIAAVIVGGTGLFIGLFLGIAGKKLAVEVDEREVAVADVLPGSNCGGCGYAGCSGLASAIAKGDAAVSACPVGGLEVSEKIAKIMGLEAMASVPMTAYVKCAGTCDKAKEDYKYFGIQSCTMMSYVQNGGAKSCNHGCLGYGTCVRECPFEAIYIENGIAVVDKDRCKACGKCITACPKKVLELVPKQQKYVVQCNSKDKGKEVMNACSAGCISCRLCVKACAFDAIVVEDNIAHIDYEKCTSCGECAIKCPKKIIETCV